MSLVKRHSLITFFFLTYALTWILWLPLVFLRDTIPDAPALVLVLLGSLIPSTLAIVLTAIVFGRRSLGTCSSGRTRASTGLERCPTCVSGPTNTTIMA
jgi:hypothetical protein